MRVEQLMDLFHRRLRFIVADYDVQRIDYHVSHGYLKLSIVIGESSLNTTEKSNLEIKISRMFDDQEESYKIKVYNSDDFYKISNTSILVYKKGVGFF